KASSDLLETYDFERMPIARKLLSFTDRIFSAGASVNPAIKLAIRFLAPMLAKFVSNIAPRYMFGFVSQLNIHYHPNKTVKEDLSRPRGKELARAGRRAPDAQMKTGGSLFDLMKGYRFNVLVMSKRVISEEARQQFEKKWRAGESLAPEAEIHWISAELSPAAITRYGVDDVLISLVRPDGYIGFQTDRF
ncbi:MAG TPA: hypothetical protein VM432_06930, partial [Bdellovibrionales bacterium]|nr:hypothetical protein [Bdellovibrionales bacterium]